MYAQKNDIHMSGQFMDADTGKKLKQGSVLVKRDGVDFMLEQTQKGGNYDILLPVGFVYDIKFDTPTHLQKIIRIDAKNVPVGKKMIGCEMQIDVPLFGDIEGFNEEVLSQPIGLCQYNAKADGMEFDAEFGKQRQAEIKSERDRAIQSKPSGKKK